MAAFTAARATAIEFANWRSQAEPVSYPRAWSRAAVSIAARRVTRAVGEFAITRQSDQREII
jgi:hypothetical protein